MIRYILQPDTRYIYNDSKEKIQINPKGVFVDLLEPMECEGACETYKARIYLPNGEVIIGRVLGFTIGLSNKDELFDGRFNGVKD